jgi:hypothetical protein
MHTSAFSSLFPVPFAKRSVVLPALTPQLEVSGYDGRC